MTHKAFDQHNIAFAAKLFRQPTDAGFSPFILVDGNVVNTLCGNFLIDSDDDDAFSGSFF